MSFRAKTRTALKDLFESHGRESVGVLSDIMAKGEVKAENFSLREIAEAIHESKKFGYSRDIQEAISSDMFPITTGQVINAAIIEEFKVAGVIGEQLCTTVPSDMEEEKLAGFEAAEMLEEVPQGQAYNESDLGEKYVTSRNRKFGRLISITLEETIFDKTKQVLERARGIGRKAALHKEREIINTILDVDGYQGYTPSGVVTTLYSASIGGGGTLGNLISSNPFGEAGMTQLLLYMQSMRDEQGDFIFVPQERLKVLLPAQLIVQGAQLADSEKVPEGNENAKNFFRGAFQPLTSPFITAQSATNWAAGDYQRAVYFTEVWPLRTEAQKQGSDDLFVKDIAARFKVSYMGNAVIVLPEYIFKCTA